ncbi:MAG TPA: twin-arginine translocase subunit TatC, partial [Candidatus Eremiobacteraceae bacterium]|nr:twin-arginine translocase subunit TatC [Candidatus Eremiobacteraceae bacterium]
EHLAELRTRLLIALVAVGVASLAAFPAMPFVLVFVERAFLPGVQLHVFSPVETIQVYIKLSLMLGIVISMPVVLYEIYAFVAPAIDRRLRARIAWYVLPSFVMSAAGIAFCGFVILPFVIRALIRINDAAGLVGTYQLDPTVGFIAILLGIFAVMFQLPVVLSILASVGLVNAAMLGRAWRHATLAIVIAAGIGAPDGNPMTMALLAVPLIALYFLSIVVVRFTQPKVARA